VKPFSNLRTPAACARAARGARRLVSEEIRDCRESQTGESTPPPLRRVSFSHHTDDHTAKEAQ